jgi:hypothetical protein
MWPTAQSESARVAHQQTDLDTRFPDERVAQTSPHFGMGPIPRMEDFFRSHELRSKLSRTGRIASQPGSAIKKCSDSETQNGSYISSSVANSVCDRRRGSMPISNQTNARTS